MADRANDLNGAERAAIFLLSLGEQDAAAVLKHMDSREVEAIGSVMAAVSQVSRDKAEKVLGTFLNKAETAGAFAVDGPEYVKRVLGGALGKQRGDLMVDRILSGPAGGAGIEALRWMDPRQVAQLIGEEHPQVIASLLAQLGGGHSAKILPLLPEKLRPDVLMRIAALQELPQSALSELDQIVGKRASTGQQGAARKLGGTRTVADIINAMEREDASAVMGEIESADGELHQKIKELLFVFDDLTQVDDRGMQAILREVSSDVLSLALRGADPGVQDKIYKNMSKRAAEILKEDMEARGPVKLTEVEAAQREIVSIAQRLAEEGTIIIGQGSSEYV